MSCHRFLFGALLALLPDSLAWAAPKPVELSLSSKVLSQTTTFEMHFIEPMVKQETVGKPDQKSPLAFRPPLKGSFTWLDPHRGVFTPTEPMPLDTTYAMTLRKGLTDADGKAFREPWSETVATPPMELRSGTTVRYIERENPTAKPGLVLTFNSNVTGKTAETSMKFVDSAGVEIPAKVDPYEKDEYVQVLFQRSGDASTSPLPWREQFLQVTQPGKPTTRAYGNRLLVQPVRPLPPGNGWKLVLAAGLASADEPVHLRQGIELPIGDVKPFAITAASGRNYVRSGKRLVVKFSKSFASNVTSANIRDWVTLDPAPADLKVESYDSEVELSGDFELGKTYKLAVDPTLPCADGLPLTAPFVKDVTVDRVPPRIYFEEFSTHQMASGSRQFHFQSVNVARVRVTAKLIAPEAAPQALERWQKYERDWDARAKADEDEPYQRVDGDKLPGKAVFEKDYETAGAVDEKKIVALDWNEILGTGRTGIVLLTAEVPATAATVAGGGGKKRPAAQAIVQVTDLGVVWKGSSHETFLYVFSLATGEPASDAEIELYDDRQTRLPAVRTDAAGTARIPENEKGEWLLVRKPGDEHLVRFADRGTINLTRFHLDDSGQEEESDDYGGLDSDETKVFLFTERDVYRPGETVHLKGIVRDYATGVSRIPAGEKLHFSAHDSRDRTILERDVAVSDSGEFSIDVPLSGTTLGSYVLSVQPPKKSIAGGSHRGAAGTDEDGNGGEGETQVFATRVVEVQEFEANPFEVTVSVPTEVLGAAPARMEMSAKYYVGKSLSNASLKWTLRAEDAAFAPAGFGEFSFCDGVSDFRLRQALDLVSDFTQQGEAELSKTGSAKIACSIPVNPKAPQPRSARLLCEVTDLDQKTVSSDGAFTVDASEYYLGLRRFPEVLREGSPLPIELAAVGRDGAPMPVPVDAKVSITRIDWQTNRIEGAGQAANYESIPIFTKASEEKVRSARVVKEGRKWRLAADADAPRANYPVAGKPGQYLLEASAKDAAGHPVTTRAMFYVYGAAQTVWNYRNPFQIELVQDRERYLAGDKAVLLVKTPISGDALVTVERENVRRAFIAHLEGNAPSIEIPLEEGDAPNVYVSVMILRGASGSTHQIKMPEYRVGYARLSVERPASKLTVYVQPDATAHRPGDPVTLTAEVLDYQGKAVPDAELTLFAVDEGILSLTGYKTPDPFEFFNRERALGVRTGLTLPQMLSEDPDDRDYAANKGFLVGDKGGEERVRKNFLACAFWSASLKTGPDGRVLGQFDAPDGLTRYRVMAVAQSVKNQFGSAESAFEINKPVMLEPAPPRFANVGDALLLRAVIHNTTDLAGTAEVRLDLDETVTAANTAREVKVPAQGSVAVDFPVEFKMAGNAKWKWNAHFTSADGSTSHHDSAEVKLKVGYPSPARHDVRFARIDEAQGDLVDRLAPDMLDGTGTMQVSIASSRMMELGEAVRSLLVYPYGCVEQTTSSMIPWIGLRSFRTTLPDLNESDEKITAAVERGLNRLLTMVTESGGLSYWPNGKEAEPWASAYGGLGMVLAKRAGFAVSENDLERLCKYLSEQLRGLSAITDQDRFSESCMALYTLAMAGKPEPAYHELLFQKIDSLSVENRALLALAIAECKGPDRMIEVLLDPAKPAPSNPEDAHWFGCASRQMALRLLAWTRFRPGDPSADALAADLLHGQVEGQWTTTQGNAWAVLALGEYAGKVEKPDHAATGTVAWGEHSMGFNLGEKIHSMDAIWPLSAAAGAAPVRVTNPDRGRLYAEVRVESRPKLIEQPRQDSGYALTRGYFKVADDGRISPLTEPVVGDRVIVTLRLVVRQPATYVAVEDPLPSILEAINPVFQSQAANVDARVLGTWNGDYSELREDRALFFANELDPGEYVISYLARVRAAGAATAPSAKIEEMYHPERFGQTATQRLTSLPLK